MAKALKVAVIGAGSAQFSLGIVRDLCLTDSLAGSHVTFMDIDEDRLDMIYHLGMRYAEQLGSKLTFDKTTNRQAALQDADFVLSTVYVLGHYVEADMRETMAKYGYYHGGAGFGDYHNFKIMLDVARDIEKICPKAWLIQSGNPVFQRLHPDDPRDEHQGHRPLPRPLRLSGDRPRHRLSTRTR